MTQKRLTKRQQRDYLQRWQKLGKLLDAVRHDELRRMTEADHLAAMEQLWSVQVAPWQRETSGLVEWQKLMKRLMSHMMEGAVPKHTPDFEFGVGHDFVNAVLYSLSDHPQAEHPARGIVVPICEAVWQEVFHRVFPESYDGENMQKLAPYCSYFRLGKHGIGYDRKGNRDFARGERKAVKDRGKLGLNVSGDPSRAVWPRKEGGIPAVEVIRVAKEYLIAHHPDAPQVERYMERVSPRISADFEPELAEIFADPIRKEMLIEAYERRASWARLARRLYGYGCMVSGCGFVLLKDDGERYIEVHHIIAMFEGGSPNAKENLSVLCPNHHREVHYARRARREELTLLIRREQRRRLAA